MVLYLRAHLFDNVIMCLIYSNMFKHYIHGRILLLYILRDWIKEIIKGWLLNPYHAGFVKWTLPALNLEEYIVSLRNDRLKTM